MTNSRDMEKFVEEFMAEQKRLAEAEGKNVFRYMAEANGGILKNTMIKLLKHARAHPKECPPDCVFQASIRELKAK